MVLPKPSLRWTLAVVSLIAVLCLALALYTFHNRPAETSITLPVAVSSSPPVQKRAIVGLPVHLKIPKITVDATLEYVSLTPGGELGVPQAPSNAAWYQLGPRPGDIGSAVIDGHFGYKNNIPAVFDNLHLLQKGDILEVEDAQGKIVRFVVSKLQSYGQKEDASDVFTSNDGESHLNLITCQGKWSNTQHSYSNRLVVFANKIAG